MEVARRLESVPEHRPVLREDQKTMMVAKAEPLTASQQISLWLVRASSQDLVQELAELGTVTRGSFRNIFRTPGDSVKAGQSHQAALRKCETDVRFRIEAESDQEEEDDQTGTESPARKFKFFKKKKNKKKPLSSKNQSNDSLMKHFSMKGMD